MALDKGVHRSGHRDDALADAKTSAGYKSRTPAEIDAMTDEEHTAWEAAYIEEIRRRGDEVEAGRAKTYSLEEVMASAYEIINAG